MLLRARHYATGAPVDVICGSTIESVRTASTAPANFSAGWVAPAFFDLQINGCDGISFNAATLTIEQVRHIAATYWRHGIAAYLPTVITGSFAALRHGVETIHRACEADGLLARCIAGIHLEGPYISADDGPRGAHPRQYVRPPDWDEFCRLQEAAGGRIRLVTLAPELPGASAFIERLVRAGVVTSLGHTAATPSQIRSAIAAGVRLSTHLGNGCHALLPRHDNPLWAQLAADELYASVICDGFHLPADVVKCLVRCKSAERVILTCDASSLAGLPPGRYREWDQDLEVLPGGKIIVAGTPYLAGSGVFTDACVGNVIAAAGVSLAQAVDMAGSRPRRLLGLPEITLEAGQPACLVLFDWSPAERLRVRGTVVHGELTRADEGATPTE